MNKIKVGVLGAGSWGTSFARYIAKTLGYRVKLWAREQEVIESINNLRENTIFLKGFFIPDNLSVSGDMEYVIKNQDVIIIAIPSKFCPEIYKKISGYLSNQYILSLTKGFDEKNINFLSSLMKEIFPENVKNKITILSGPSFSVEVAKEFPTAVVVASEKEKVAKFIQNEFSSQVLRIYTTTDITGVELGGALKNVIAIASGMASGLGFGYNTLASLITRGNVEITRLGLKIGGKEQTFLGLSGIGDLMLTCFGDLSRNRRFGYRIGLGEKKEDILKSSKSVIEGLTTVKTALKLAKKHGVEMPITESVYKIIYNNASLKKTIKRLMGRSLKKEWNIK